MSTQVILKADRRHGTGKGVSRKLRAAGKLPAVLYGGDKESLSLSMDANETLLLFQSISVENTIVNLQVDGAKAPIPSLVREIQVHPYKTEILHVDFLRIQEGVEVELEVPIELIGTPTGVSDQGGVLEQTQYVLPVACVPDAIPDVLEIDVAGLTIGDSLQVRDLNIPEGVRVLMDEDQTLCSVQAPSVTAGDKEDDADGEPTLVGEDDPEAPVSDS
ncbi:MAG: 50S ribosomal protein L25 [Gemmatimonadales bacterium]|nr:MAG: 50S ribosomal protein L25 [Gemmatimonadales bacterium]